MQTNDIVLQTLGTYQESIDMVCLGSMKDMFFDIAHTSAYIEAISEIEAHMAREPKKQNRYPYMRVGPPPLRKPVTVRHQQGLLCCSKCTHERTCRLSAIISHYLVSELTETKTPRSSA
jgi:hypothetical protein